MEISIVCNFVLNKEQVELIAPVVEKNAANLNVVIAGVKNETGRTGKTV